MGLRAWLRGFGAKRSERSGASGSSSAQHTVLSGQSDKTNAAGTTQSTEIAPGFSAQAWEELPAFLPIETKEHVAACVVAAAIAAGDAAQSSFSIKSICVANPEYRRAACIATALGAGALEKSTFVVKKIYKHKVEQEILEDNHAA